MHDYYRIAEIAGAARASARHAPAWAWAARSTGPRQRSGGTGQRLHLVRGLEPERQSERVWRDEVALDFPSVSQALARARRGFTDAEAPGVRIALDLVLSTVEARRGARVPIQLHLPSLCEPCGGRGEAWDEPCVQCQGRGTAPATRYVVLRVPAASTDGSRLRYRLALPYGPRVRLDVRLTVR